MDIASRYSVGKGQILACRRVAVARVVPFQFLDRLFYSCHLLDWLLGCLLDSGVPSCCSMLFVGRLWPLFVRPYHDYESTADSSCFVPFLFFSGEDRSCTVLSFGFELYYYDYVPTVVIFRDEGN